MLTARRFTTVPTKDCCERLEAAADNRRPIARGEPNRGAVMAIQSALADLNRGYLLVAEVDGYFGPRTYAAVEAFQRDYGLAADGIVGRQTMSQLDTLYSSDVIRAPHGLSIHIGLNSLNPDHYGGDFRLGSCVNDAHKMRDIAQSLGYDATTLEDDQATVSNFTGFMRSAINDLYAGDSLMVTFSGHGAQIPNISSDAEADNRDETLCFYDRMLVDDEFYSLLAEFREGVRVHAVFDSCHSGTVAKDLVDVGREREEYRTKTLASLGESGGGTDAQHKDLAGPGGGAGAAEPVPDRPFAADELSKALDNEGGAQVGPPQPTENRNQDVADLFADLHADEVPTDDNKKQLDEQDWNEVYNNHKDLYDAIANLVRNASDQELACSVITLSACQDSQTTPAGRVYSLFTYNVATTWGTVGFTGSYRQFNDRLVSISRPDATAQLNTYGSNMANARLFDRPFAF